MKRSRTGHEGGVMGRVAIMGSVSLALSCSALFFGGASPASASVNSTATARVVAASSISTATCLARSKSILATANKQPKFSVTKLPKPVSKLKLSGKTAWFITPLEEASVFDTMAQSFAAAGKTIGLSTRTYDAGESPTTADAALSEAVDNQAAFIVIDGVQTNGISAGLSAALAHHIPVVSIYEPPTTAIAKKAITQTVNVSTAVLGKYTLATALVATGCHMTMGVMYTTALSAETESDSAVTSILPQLCSACEIVQSPLQIATEATTSAQQATSLVASHPGMNDIFLAGPSLISTVVPAIIKAYPSVKIESSSATPPGLADLKSVPNTYIGDTDTGSFPLAGWIGMDAGLRAYAHFPQDKTVVVPERELTPTNDPSDVYPELDNYPALFTTAWKG